MKKENLKFNFKRVYLNKSNNTEKETTLQIVLKNFIGEKLNKKEIIVNGEKEVILNKADFLNNGDILWTYELINFGKKSKIKDKDTLVAEGELNVNQYLEKYQYIYLNKKDEDNYNVIHQLTKQGISYNKFYNILHNYYESFKNEQVENLADTLLMSSTYYSKDFFKRINEVNMLSSLTIEGGYDDPDLKFAGLATNPDFTCSSFTQVKVKPKKGKFKNFLAKDILKFIEKMKEKYGPVKIKLHGKDIKENTQKIYSDNLELAYEVKIDVHTEKEIEYNEVITKLKTDIPRILEQGWVEIASN